MKNLRRFKYVGSKSKALDYVDVKPELGRIYDCDFKIGNIPVEYWAMEVTDRIGAEWELVVEDEIVNNQPACDTYYAGEKSYMSLSISTVKDGKEVNINFGTNDLSNLKDFVNYLSQS